MSTETNHDYCRRAAVSTLLWLEDRSANLHPLFREDLSLVDSIFPPTEYGRTRKKLNGKQREHVLTMLISAAMLRRGRDLPEAHRGAIAERAAVIAAGMTITAGCVRQAEGAAAVRLTLSAKEVEK